MAHVLKLATSLIFVLSTIGGSTAGIANDIAENAFEILGFTNRIKTTISECMMLDSDNWFLYDRMHKIFSNKVALAEKQSLSAMDERMRDAIVTLREEKNKSIRSQFIESPDDKMVECRALLKEYEAHTGIFRDY